MATPVEQIKGRLTIQDVVGSYVQLQKAGKNFKARSPFTSEKTPSFFVSPDRGMYYCFSSGQGGDMFTFVERMEGVDFKGALKILAERAGVELTPEDPKARTERETLHTLLETATQFFEINLRKHPLVAAYLQERGVTDESVKNWRIGYAPDEWRALKEHLLEKGFSKEMIARSGLVKVSDGQRDAYDVFRDRVMFPIADTSGRIVAFSGRRFKDDPATPKYVNSPETELFVKSDVLFGYHLAKSGIRKFDFSLIVEGQFDLVMAHQVGYTNTIAISGTALSPQHIGLLSRLSNRAVLALDADEAGITSVKRSAGLMLRRGMDVKVARMIGGKDPADLAKEDPARLKKAIGSATHVIEFLIAVLKDEAKDERAFRLRVRDEVVPFVVAIPNRIDQEYFEKIVAERIGTTVDAIHHEVVRSGREEGARAKENTSDPVVVAEKKYLREDDIVAHLFATLLWLEAGNTAESVTKDMLEGHLATILGEEGMTKLRDWPEEKKNEALFRVEKIYDTDGEDVPELARVLPDLLRELYVRRVKGRLKDARAKLEVAERAGDSAESEELIARCNELQKELANAQNETLFSYTNV